MSDNLPGNILKCVPSQKNFSFSENTTYGCGGVAETAYFPRTEDEACLRFDALTNRGEKFFILGSGSNVLACDGVYDGAVICTSQLDDISFKAEGGNILIDAACGVKNARLMSLCKKNGFTGLEFLAGIPATIGGMVYMNAGSGTYISDCIKSVRFYDGKLHDISADECKFGYKHSIMRDIKCVITRIKLSAKRENPYIVEKNIKDVLAARRRLPRGKSCGCVFENYCGVSAGKLIESAGLKGERLGCAVVSPEHCNFIISDGERSSDVYRLIQRVKDRVYEKFGITLKEEVCYIGDFK